MTVCPALALLFVGLVCQVPVDHVVDGDTFWTRFGGERHKVRLVGVDTPERDEAGYGAATDAARAAFEGRTVTLTVGGGRAVGWRVCRGQAVFGKYGRVLGTVPGWAETIAAWDKGPWCRETADVKDAKDRAPDVWNAAIAEAIGTLRGEVGFYESTISAHSVAQADALRLAIERLEALKAPD